MSGPIRGAPPTAVFKVVGGNGRPHSPTKRTEHRKAAAAPAQSTRTDPTGHSRRLRVVNEDGRVVNMLQLTVGQAPGEQSALARPGDRGPPGDVLLAGSGSRSEQPGDQRIHSGNVQIGDKRVDIRQNDTILSVISRINGLGAGVRAVFDARTETIRLVSGEARADAVDEAINEARGSPEQVEEDSAPEESAETAAGEGDDPASKSLGTMREALEVLAEIYGRGEDPGEGAEMASTSPFEVDDDALEASEEGRKAASLEARERLLKRARAPETRELRAIRKREKTVGKKLNLRA